MEEAIIFCW